jgi:hypothetical protein
MLYTPWATATRKRSSSGICVLRDEALRDMAAFRHCPSRACSNAKKDDTAVYRPLMGGGFVTSSCLASSSGANPPLAFYVPFAIASVAFLCTMCILGEDDTVFERCHNALWFCFTASLSFVLVYFARPIWIEGSYLSSEEERLARFKTTPVACRCCQEEFQLPAGNVESSSDENKASELWKRGMTRPCPKCKVPIQKNGGCPIVKCTSCRSKFWW